MAITRAQQAKQMLQEGGRLGYRFGSRGYQGSDASTGKGGASKGPSSSGGGGSKSSGGGNQGGGGDDRRESYITDYSSQAKVKGGGSKKPTMGGAGDEGYDDFQYTKDNRTKAMEDKFRRDRGLSTLNLLSVGVPPANTPSFLANTALDLFAPFRNFSLRKNIDYFKGLKSRGRLEDYDLTAQGYKDYMSARLAGEIDAAGNPISRFDDDSNDNQILFPQDMEDNAGGGGGGSDDTDDKDDTNTRGLALRFRKDGGRINAMDGGRIGFRIGSDSGKDTSGRDYASDTAASRSVATSPSRDTGGGDNNQQTVTAPVKISKPVKDAANTAGELMFLRNVINLNPIGIMKNIGSKMIMDKLISEADTEDENMMLADVSAMDIKRKNQFKNLDYGTAKDIGMINPTMTQEEFEGVKSGEITEPTGQFAADGGRIGAMDGGMMSPEGGIMDLETGRQMYFLGKLVKKATRAVKKIVKSPIGKAALLYGAGSLGASFLGKTKAAGGLGKFFLGTKGVGMDGGLPGFLFDKGLIKGGFGTFGGLTGKGMLSAGALALSPLLFSQQEDDEEDLTIDRGPGLDIAAIRANPYDFLGQRFRAEEGGKAEPVAKKTMPLLDMGGKEMDLREDGGFVPIGRMEKADDVPARLSKNEFVFTADAVRNAGEGDVDKGAEVMYNMMKNLESGGEVSEESQGLQGARDMFQTSKRLEEVL